MRTLKGLGTDKGTVYINEHKIAAILDPGKVEGSIAVIIEGVSGAITLAYEHLDEMIQYLKANSKRSRE